jgi:ribosome-binding protein aMBF1 (putative translation factor)
MSDHQDWEPVVLVKKTTPEKKPQSTMTNVQKSLLNDEEPPKLKYIDREFAKQIVTARIAKKMNRKQLANAMSIPESTVAAYENATALHNGPMVARFKSFLGINKTNQ